MTKGALVSADAPMQSSNVPDILRLTFPMTAFLASNAFPSRLYLDKLKPLPSGAADVEKTRLSGGRGKASESTGTTGTVAGASWNEDMPDTVET